jgi:rare lipoprotein A
MSRARGPVLVAAAGLLLAGCGSAPQYGGGHRHYAAGRPHYTVAPYQVNGVWFYPKVDYAYDRTGTASWYGPGFDGRATADGELYDMNDLTAAHKTLPLPSVVEVTNLENGRELTLRLNDRGPFIGDRLIDVSRRAAQLLGFARAGTATVRVRILREPSIQIAAAAMRGAVGPPAVAATAPAPHRVEFAAAVLPAAAAPAVELPPPSQVEPPPQLALTPPPQPPIMEAPIIEPPARFVSAPPPRRRLAAARNYWPSLIASAQAATLDPRRRIAAAPARRIFIQAGAFSVAQNALWVRAKIAALGSTEIVPARAHGIALYQVRLGPVHNDAEALRLLSAVLDRGFDGARLIEQ